MKTHWRNLSDQPHLGAWTLEEDGQFKPIVVTIERIFQDELIGQMGKQKKVFIKLKEFQKTMVCNTTNFSRLERRFGTFDYNKFIGGQVTLTVEEVNNPQQKGTKIPALRFSARPPQVQSQQPKQKELITDERLEQAITAINDPSNVQMTKEAFLKKYQLNDSQQKKLDESC